MGKITVKHYLNKKLNPEIDEGELYYPLYVSISVNRKFINRRSHTMKTATEKDFESGLVNLQDLKRHIEYEKNILSRIVKIFLNDIENKTIKKDILSISKEKGYSSKDDFINQMNAYIDFYSKSIFNEISQYCTTEIENEIFEKISNLFNLQDFKAAKKLFSYNSPLNETDFIYNNLSKNSIELFVLRETLRRFLAPYSIKTDYDIPLIDWIENLIQNDLKEYFIKVGNNPDYYIKNGFIINSELIDTYLKLINRIIYIDE